MEPNINDFLAIFTEFDNEPEARINFQLNAAKNNVSSDAFKANYLTAVYLLTAHNLEMFKISKAGKGSVASERAGDLSIGYFNSGNTAVSFGSSLGQTQYGLQFLELSRNSIITAQVL